MWLWVSVAVGVLAGLNLLALGLCRAASDGVRLERAAFETHLRERRSEDDRHRGTAA